MSKNLLAYKDDAVHSIVIDGVRWCRATDIGRGFWYVNASQLTTTVSLPPTHAAGLPLKRATCLLTSRASSGHPTAATWLAQQYPDDAAISAIEQEETKVPLDFIPYKEHLDSAIEPAKSHLAGLLQARELLFGGNF